MSTRISLVIILALALGSCRKEEKTLNTVINNTITGKETLLATGTFVSGAHATSGTVKLYGKNGDKSLVFQNFQTDSGPDLYVYLSKNTGNNEFVSLGRLPGNGNFSVEVPAGVDTDRLSTVLIWCRQFSVHFGNAPLIK
jgi:hypothetical protein